MVIPIPSSDEETERKDLGEQSEKCTEALSLCQYTIWRIRRTVGRRNQIELRDIPKRLHINPNRPKKINNAANASSAGQFEKDGKGNLADRK